MVDPLSVTEIVGFHLSSLGAEVRLEKVTALLLHVAGSYDRTVRHTMEIVADLSLELARLKAGPGQEKDPAFEEARSFARHLLTPGGHSPWEEVAWALSSRLALAELGSEAGRDTVEEVASQRLAEVLFEVESRGEESA